MRRGLAVRALVTLFSLTALFAAMPVDQVTARAPEADSVSSECNRRRPHRRRRAPRRRARRPARPPRVIVTQAYIRMRTLWHRPPARAARTRWLANAVPPLVIKPVGGGEMFTLTPERDGTFGPEALAIAREAFRYRNDRESTDIHPRLLEIAYRAAKNFEAPYVHLVSGYRTTRSTSRHNQGRAMDIVMPGVPDERLAAYLRRQGYVGVGVYPASGFTHLDVRARSYFWVDRSGPNQASRAEGTLSHLVSRYDAEARRRHETPVPDLVSGAAETGEGGTDADVPEPGESGPVNDATNENAPSAEGEQGE